MSDLNQPGGSAVEDDMAGDVNNNDSNAAGEGGSEGKSKGNSKGKGKTATLSNSPQKLLETSLANLPPEQLAELMSKNPALANEFTSIAGESSATSGLDPAKAAEFLKKLSLQDVMTGLAATGKGAKDMASYKFWQTQPVPKFGDNESELRPEGPIKKQKLEDIPKNSPKMLDGFEWVTMDIEDADQLKEVYELLNGHYVEDDEAMFRFNYSPSILQWAMMPPGWKPQWHIGVRATQSRKLVAFISGIPCRLRVRDNEFDSSEVNFICVHKKLRGKRLAPVLIKEVTRLINLEQVWQAIYTAGVVLPKPVSTCRYFHRAINWQKLYDVGFSPCPTGSKPQLQVRKYHLPDKTSTKGLRVMEAKDIDAVKDLLDSYLKRFDIVPVFSREEVDHWFFNKKSGREQVIFSYVVETDGKITDFFSFYALESSVINNSKHNIIRAAYLYYYATDTGLTSPVDKDALNKRLNALVRDALIIARQNKFDVFNALSLMDNALFLEQQKFGPGDGQLHYYLFNYFANPISGGVDRKNHLDKDGLSKVGFVML